MRKNLKKSCLIAAVISLSILLFGCWDAQDMEDKNILTSVVVDKTMDGYSFYVNVAALSSGEQKKSKESGNGESGSTKFALIQSEGKTLIEARENLDRNADHPIFLGAVQSVVLTDQLANHGIEEYMLRLRQIPEYRKTVDFVTTDESPQDLLRAKSENSAESGFTIHNTIKSLVDNGLTFDINLADILEALASPNKCFLLHAVTLDEDLLAANGFSVFDSAICIGKIPKEETKGIVLLKVENPRLEFVVPFSEGHVSVRFRKFKKSIAPLLQGEQISFDIRFEIGAQVEYPDKSVQITKEMQQEIVANLQAMISDEIVSTMNTSQTKFAADYLGFYDVFRIKYPQQAKKIDWKKYYPSASYTFASDVQLDIISTIDYSAD